MGSLRDRIIDHQIVHVAHNGAVDQQTDEDVVHVGLGQKEKSNGGQQQTTEYPLHMLVEEFVVLVVIHYHVLYQLRPTQNVVEHGQHTKSKVKEQKQEF